MTHRERIATAKAELAILEARVADARARLEALEAATVRGGPDVSSYQGAVDWPKVRGAGFELAVCKVSDGDKRDPTFTRTRVDEVRAAGLVLGTYYFARVASEGNGQRNGRSEAAMAVYFAQSMGALKPGDLPLAYDLETLNGQPAAKVAGHAGDFIRAYRYLTGHHPLLYTTPDFMGALRPAATDSDLEALAKCPLWLAHWGVVAPSVPAPWQTWALWQHTDKGTVPGIAGPVDLNRFAGDIAELKALTIAA